VEIAGYCGVPAAGSDDVTAESVCDVPLHDKPAEKPAEKHIEKIPDKPAEKPKPSWQPPASIPEVSGHVNNTPAPHEDLEPLPQGDDYASAYARARATGRPFLVLIGAKWCIPCQQLESEPYISQLRSRGELAVLDADRDKDLAKTLAVIQGGVFLLPQLAIFSRVDRLREKALVGQEIFDWLKSAQPQAGASNTEASGDYVDVELPCKHKDKMETSP
jgi:thiol-disulfide isomerase/thioredoxin